jgi:hypothetical protein
MWLSVGFAFLLVLIIVGSFLLGGVFTIILIPLALIAGMAAVGYVMWGRAQGSADSQAEAHSGGPDPLPVSGHQNVGDTPASPGDLTDARRLQQ